MALILARSSAIVRGRRLSEEEMENLGGELFALPDPLYTPSGNRIYTVLDENAISGLLPEIVYSILRLGAQTLRVLSLTVFSGRFRYVCNLGILECYDRLILIKVCSRD